MKEATRKLTAKVPKIEWGAEFAEVVMYKVCSDASKDIVNRVCHAFAPPMTGRVYHPVLIIQRFQATLSPTRSLNVVDQVNDDSFYGASAGQAIMKLIAIATI